MVSDRDGVGDACEHCLGALDGDGYDLTLFIEMIIRISLEDFAMDFGRLN